MLELAVMIEGQNGLNWDRWQRLARAVEELGFIGLYRSDHFTNATPPDKDALELWVSLTWLACNTRRIEFGPLVTPVSFRPPALTARIASAVDDLSGGRLTLGIGAGWQEREHTNYGFDLLDLKSRFERFEEGVQIIQRLLHSDAPVNYSGKYFRLNEARVLPRPARRIPLLIGGNGEKRTLTLAARYADEWNATFQTPANFERLSMRLDELLAEYEGEPRPVRRSLMTGCVYGKDHAALQTKIAARNRTVDELRERGIIVGNTDQVVEQLGKLSEAGVQRVMLQWLDLDDLAGLEALAKNVLPQIS
jgi:F420-dependent oxidoreductase-like protein